MLYKFTFIFKCDKKFIQLKTIAVQSEIMQLIKDDEELVIEFAKSLINNYKIEDLESYVKKLKIDKQDKELINTMLIAAKLI